MTQLTKVKQNTQKNKYNLNHKKDKHTEKVAHLQYKIVQKTFPFNLKTMTITFDVVKWRTGFRNREVKSRVLGLRLSEAESYVRLSVNALIVV